MYGWFWEYYVTSTGLEFRLFRVLPVYWLRHQHIVSARVVTGWFGGFKFGCHPWNTVSLGNRLRWNWVLVQKRRCPRFLAITPDDPEGFVARLNLHANPQ